ncbi:MAG TPA: alpha/beta fold hydrolase, partial [Steroidobacteraceae bacterium]|nr:alpha/beta fold hydrolase [Steroidobacteraceae bacterium]
MKKINLRCATLVVSILMAGVASPVSGKDTPPKDLWDRVEHHNADSNGVKIHYVAIGKGPLIVMIHGFPDFWYTWRKQMDALSGHYRVVAVDQRGYDLSDRPTGIAQYA